MQNLQLIQRDGVEYITSTALAEFFNKRHDHVLRDIRQMEPKWFEAFNQVSPNLGCPKSFLQVDVQIPMPNGRGFKITKEYALTRDQALYVATKYDDVMRAKLVQDWVVTKAQVVTNELPHDYLSALKALVASEEAKQLVETKNRELALKIQEDAPKVGYYETVINSKDLLPITIIAKDLGMSAQELNAVLSNLDVQYRVGGDWVLYSKYQGLGYTKTKDITYPTPDGEVHVKTHTYWTQKGREFIVNLLREQKIID